MLKLAVYNGASRVDIGEHVIAPRRTWQDLTGNRARAREARDGRIVLTRLDQHVCWRRETLADYPASELRRVFSHLVSWRIDAEANRHVRHEPCAISASACPTHALR